jgi:hypothetical protein
MNCQPMNEKKNITDYSGKAFISSCVAESIIFFITKNQHSSLCKLGAFYISGLFGYFILMGFMKRLDKESYWSGADVFWGFVSPLLAGWVMIPLGLIFGFGLNY